MEAVQTSLSMGVIESFLKASRCCSWRSAAGSQPPGKPWALCHQHRDSRVQARVSLELAILWRDRITLPGWSLLCGSVSVKTCGFAWFCRWQLWSELRDLKYTLQGFKPKEVLYKSIPPRVSATSNRSSFGVSGRRAALVSWCASAVPSEGLQCQ